MTESRCIAALTTDAKVGRSIKETEDEDVENRNKTTIGAENLEKNFWRKEWR